MAEPLIVFVCTANICRSPWAEARGRQLLTGFDVASAGVLSSTVGRPMDPVMAETLPKGATADTHRAQLISAELASRAALLLTMELKHRLWIVDEFPAAIRKTFTLGQFAATAAAAPEDLPLAELLQWAYRNRVAPSSRADVADPYRQGAERAAQTAAQLDGLLTQVASVLVPALGRP